MIILLLTLFFVAIITISLLIGAIGVPYVPTPSKVIRSIDQLGLIKDGTNIVELGSGDAKFLRYFFSKYQVNAQGYEIAPMLIFASFLLCWRTKCKTKRKELVIHAKSFSSADISKTDVVYCYLLPQTLKKLAPNFQTMKKGSLIISYDFAIHELPVEQVLKLPKGKKILVYRIV